MQQTVKVAGDLLCPRCRTVDVDMQRARGDERDYQCAICGLAFTEIGGVLHWDGEMNDWRG